MLSTAERTKDLEVCLDGRAKEWTTVGASFSMECRLCEDWCLSALGGADTGRKFGGAGERNQIKMKDGDWLQAERYWMGGGRTSLPYHGLGGRVVPAAPCAILLSIRAHRKSAGEKKSQRETEAPLPEGENGYRKQRGERISHQIRSCPALPGWVL